MSRLLYMLVGVILGIGATVWELFSNPHPKLSIALMYHDLWKLVLGAMFLMIVAVIADYLES